MSTVKQHLDARFRPDGYNVGFNDGKAAGQTIFIFTYTSSRATGET